MRHPVSSVILPLAPPRASASRAAVTPDAERGVEWLIDNRVAYERLVAAIRGAHRSIRMSQLAFDADCVAYATGESARLGEDGGSLLVDALLHACASAASIDVRLLLNASLLVDTTRALRRRLRAAGDPGRRIEVRGVRRFPQLLHAKLLVVDDREAFLIGSPFVNGYWDDSRHRPLDARRPLRELGGRPLHDLSIRLTGHAVAELAAIFDQLWDACGQPRRAPARAAASPPAQPSVAPDARAAVGIASTMPRRMLASVPRGVTQILDACLRGISRARSLIYIEHQYLSSRPVIGALAAALACAPELEMVVVLNQNPDVTAYRGWQNARLRESGLLHHPRVGVFALWSAERTEATGTQPAITRLNQVFVHSKVLTVDDGWATVGSANLDGVSLDSYGDDFSGRLARRIFRTVRNIDVNVVLDDDVHAAHQAWPVRDLRTRLWAEHLGGEPTGMVNRPATGWLPVWRARARANVAALGCGAVATPSFILPYSERATPARQLADVGVRSQDGTLDLRFTPGWLEVHCSPGWVRNMFT